MTEWEAYITGPNTFNLLLLVVSWFFWCADMFCICNIFTLKNTTKIREMHICSYAYRNQKTLETLDNFLGSGTKLFITFLSLSFFGIRRERHNFFLCWLFHLTPSRAAPRRKLLVSPRGAPENQLPSSTVECPLFCLFSNPKILSPSLPGMTSFTSPVTLSIRGFYCDICDCHILPARAWTPALNVCT